MTTPFESVQRDATTEGLEPSLNTYNAKISACGKGEQWEKVLSLLDRRMQRKGLEPNVSTYNATLSACEDGECVQSEKGFALLDEKCNKKGLKPNFVNALIIKLNSFYSFYLKTWSVHFYSYRTLSQMGPRYGGTYLDLSHWALLAF
mmetsp:Transcript_16530/g.21534  ORF Transcript_16530/g.21534 Transcript_16530/m.21534 type:complete len:147 (-) Transcript_16530:78-518(-)